MQRAEDNRKAVAKARRGCSPRAQSLEWKCPGCYLVSWQAEFSVLASNGPQLLTQAAPVFHLLLLLPDKREYLKGSEKFKCLQGQVGNLSLTGLLHGLTKVFKKTVYWVNVQGPPSILVDRVKPIGFKS